MGLLDVLNGMKNGPHGAPGAQPSSGGGVSKIDLALLALVAYRAWQGKGPIGSMLGRGQQANPAPSPSANPATPASTGGLGGGLGGLLGGLLAGGAAGSVLSGGLGDLMKQLQQNGHGETASSWVGTGDNKPIAPGDLAAALGGDTISALTSATGMSQDELLQGLSRALPGAIDELTPQGRLPTEQEVSRWV